ncbi:MAG: DUF6335 family protein [Anaerolineales bacterium]
MSEEKKEKKQVEEPQTEDEKYVEVVPVDKEEREGEDYLLEEEMPLEKLAADERSEDIVERQTRYAEDEAVAEDLEERQKLAHGGREKIKEELEETHFSSPELAGGDIDADWESADTGGGAEAVGGTEPTPDQDVVDELGEAVGITYEDDEPLNIEKKMKERREKRLEPRQDREDVLPHEKEREEDEE